MQILLTGESSRQILSDCNIGPTPLRVGVTGHDGTDGQRWRFAQFIDYPHIQWIGDSNGQLIPTLEDEESLPLTGQVGV